MPTAATSTPDQTGHLWGHVNGASCAFKDAAGHALFYTAYEPGSWLHTPACSMPAFSDNSVADSKLRVRGWSSQPISLGGGRGRAVDNGRQFQLEAP